MAVFITGDTHADFDRFSVYSFYEQKEMTKEDYVIICGDFGGVWSRTEKFTSLLKQLEDKPYTTLFVDGNHENFDMLYEYPIKEWNGGRVHVVSDSVYHLVRGQVFEIENKNYFTMGGAASQDIKDGILEMDDPEFHRKRQQLNMQMGLYRINHLSWWKEEMPNDEEYAEGLANLEKHNWTVDYIITHCCPTSIQTVLSEGFFKADTLTDYLETIKNKTTFHRWFFGHYHENKRIGEKFYLLYNMILDEKEYRG